jgi:hypothetical protein
MPRHSTVVGGSSASRLLNCPGSPALLAQLPEVTNRDTVYTVEGTALHMLMEQLITRKVGIDHLPPVIQTEAGEVEITQELIHDAVLPAWAYWNDFLPIVDSWMIEAEVAFPLIDNAFGTADVIGRDDRDNITYITDWKFCAGEGVRASYPVEGGGDETPNEQLMFYAAAAHHTYPLLFPAGCRVVLTIVQPRARGQDPITSVEVDLTDLEDFVVRLSEAVNMPDPPTRKGRWCRFQPCQTICPHHTGPLLDLSAIKPPDKIEPEYMETLLKILEVAPAAENLIREARAQAHLLLANGEEVPGWKLVAKRGTRQWAVAEKKLPRLLKLKKAALYDTILKSPAAVEKLLPPKTKLPEGAAVMVSSGTTIAPASDKRPVVTGGSSEISKILIEVLGQDS